MKSILIGVLLLISVNEFKGWEVLAMVRYTLQYVEQFGGEFDMPVFPEALKEKEGEELLLEGHFLPFDLGKNTIVISKYPYAACFFCGGAGPESLAEVQLSEKLKRKLEPDEIIKVVGKLKLNDSDYEHHIFILEEAKIIEEKK